MGRAGHSVAISRVTVGEQHPGSGWGSSIQGQGGGAVSRVRVGEQHPGSGCGSSTQGQGVGAATQGQGGGAAPQVRVGSQSRMGPILPGVERQTSPHDARDVQSAIWVSFLSRRVESHGSADAPPCVTTVIAE